MLAYSVRRLLLVIPTLLGIMVVNFVVIQAAPGGPIDVIVAQMRGMAVDATARFSAQGRETLGSQGGEGGQRTGAGRGLRPEVLADLERRFGFDKPLGERFVLIVQRFVRFEFGDSVFTGRPVTRMVTDAMPVSISLGLTTTIIIYLVAIPLGIRKAVRADSRFDRATTVALSIGDSIPSFLFALLLIVLFAGGSFLQLFPLRGLTSVGHENLSLLGQIADRAWHLVLPVSAMVVSGFAGLAMLTRNAFLDEIGKLYVVVARAKGLAERHVLYGHVFRNAMLLVIAGFPAAFLGIFFSSNLLIEILFSLDGLGAMGFTAAINRDYPVIFATLYVFTLIGLVMTLVRDLTYSLVDPRIDFAGR